MERKNIYEIKRHLPFTSGSESYIYRLGNKKIFKEFISSTLTETLNRKMKKLELLETRKAVKDFYPKLDSIVMSILTEYMRGYIMEEVFGTFPTPSYSTSDEKVKILKNMQYILRKFIENNIYYYDIREPNIIIREDGSICFLDIDNILIDEYSNDIFPTALTKYIMNGGKDKESSVIAMFNIFTKEFLGMDETSYEKEGKEILMASDVLKPDTIFDHEYLFEYIKK